MKTNYTPPRYKFDPQRNGDRNGKRLLLLSAAMTVLMGVTACEGPPVLEYESVDEHVGQNYINPPEVELIFEEPSSDAEGEIPLPLGFTEESWKECHLHARNLLGEAGYQALLAEIEGGSEDSGGDNRECSAPAPPDGMLIDIEDAPLFQREGE